MRREKTPLSRGFCERREGADGEARENRIRAGMTSSLAIRGVQGLTIQSKVGVRLKSPVKMRLKRDCRRGEKGIRGRGERDTGGGNQGP